MCRSSGVRVVTRSLILAAVVALAVGVAAGAPLRPAGRAEAAGACGSSSLTAAQLNAVFANPGIGGGAGGGYGGGDYQHVYPLPDGRNLWLFQDVFFSPDNDLRNSLTAASHNAGLVQDGNCWTTVGAPYSQDFVGKTLTTGSKRWFWPLDGDIGYDGKLWVFFAEMRNPYGTGASTGAAPYATWVARIDPSSLAVLSFTLAPNSGTQLYGWSITSDDTYSYLYGHCYRQFVRAANSVAQFDSVCMPHSYLARVVKGHFDWPLEYWTASGWSTNPFAAKPLMTRGAANPMDVQKFGDVYVNVTKIDDWWGVWTYVDKAPNPWGPWEQDQSIYMVNERRCSNCGVYHAHLLPYLDSNGQMIISYSNGAPFSVWQQNAYLYRPMFRNAPLPTYRTDAAVGDVGMTPRTPVRAIDTRLTGQRLRGGSFVKVPLTGKVAAGAVGTVVNLTVVYPSAPGFLTAWPCGARMPLASVVNYMANSVIANSVHVRLGPSQELCVFSWADADIVVDVAGSYVPSGGSGLHPSDPTRVYGGANGTTLPANTNRSVPLAGVAGVPASGVAAATFTVTVSNAAGPGYLVAWPCSQSRPLASNLNFFPGDTVSGSVTVPLGTGGDVCLFSPVAALVSVDLAGWWDATGERASLVQPFRALDTRSGTVPAAGSTVVAPLAAQVPAGTVAVVANVTVVGAAAAGHVDVWSCAVAPTGASISHGTGDTKAGVAAVALSEDGEWCLTTASAAHLLIDVMVLF